MSSIRPAYPPNAPIAELRTADLFVVCAARLWVARFLGNGGNPRDLENGFAAARVAPAGLAGLCRFFDAVTAAAQRVPDVRCMRCPRLGADEARLLQAVCLLQHGSPDAAAAALDGWVPAAAQRLALLPLEHFADALADAGLVLLRRHAEAARNDAALAPACSDRGLALVH